MAYRLRQITVLVVSAVLFGGAVAGERTRGLSDEIASALERAGDNKSEILSALDKAPERQRQGMKFLIANMPQHDIETLSAEFLLENTDLAYRALQARPWADRIPTEIFLNNILPYANVNERRDAWRKDFRDRFGPAVKDCNSPAEAGEVLNRTIFKQLNVKYSRRRPKPDQSPRESMEASVASCTGLSILLIDACRAVGVPARFVGTPLWADRSGNHSWVEIWDDGWHFTGAAEPGAKGLDHGWFVHKASMAKHDPPRHAIYAVSYKKTPLRFPLVWNRSIDYVRAVDVTDRYTQESRPLEPGKSRLSIRVYDRKGGSRVAAKVTIRSTEDGRIVFEGTSKDERFDLNDDLIAQVPSDKEYDLEFRHGSNRLSRPLTPREQEVHVPINLSDGQNAVDVRVWEKVELAFEAQRQYANPYTDVDVWVQLKGPDFDEKIYGFWDGSDTFKVRVLADKPGTWTWTSGSNQNDGGLNGKAGSFEAVAWTAAEIEENPNTRGLIRTNPRSPHGLIYADGTPFFFIADTWWAAMTWRYPFTGGKDIPASYAPDESNWCFEGGVQWLKRLGFNSIGFIASFPNWTDDNYGRKVTDDDGVVLRQGWPKAPTGKTIKNMNDQDGNMPFRFPGKSKGRTDVCADFDRINPAYWRNMDKKMDYLWRNGFVPYIETVRRDHYAAWTTYYDFKESFARYLHYIKARYGTYNFIYSLSHNDVRPRSKNDITVEVFAHYHKKYGPMPFGQPVTAMMAESSLKYLGHVDTAPFLTCHCCGNWKRDHQILDYVRDIYEQEPAVPGFNNEPYYSWHDVGFGRPDGERVVPNSDRDNYFARSHAYDNFFSGAFAGHVFGSGSFGGDTKGEPAYSVAPKWPKIWQTLQMPNYRQAGYFREFVLSEGPAYQDLLLATDDLSGPRTKSIKMDEWSFMLRSPDKRLALLYFENKATRQNISNMLPSREYEAQWYNPRTGRWFDMGQGSLTSDRNGRIELPAFPSGQDTARNDWAAKMKAF